MPILGPTVSPYFSQPVGSSAQNLSRNHASFPPAFHVLLRYLPQALMFNTATNWNAF